jgi:predicted metal-dependent hydrolase
MTFDLTPTLMQTLPEYRIRQSSRARHVNLTIHPADGLVVVIPRGFDERLIPGLIHKQRAWIEAHLKQFEHISVNERWQRPTHAALPAANENWAIEYHANPSTTVRFTMHEGDVLRATGAIDDQQKLRVALQRWLKRRAQHLLPPRLTELAEMHGFSFTRATIRLQRSRWGSYSSRGTISLNAKLLFVPVELVDHVLLHELCHSIHPHHGEAFQTLLASLEPSHRQQRAALSEAWAAIPAWAHR